MSASPEARGLSPRRRALAAVAVLGLGLGGALAWSRAPDPPTDPAHAAQPGPAAPESPAPEVSASAPPLAQTAEAAEAATPAPPAAAGPPPIDAQPEPIPPTGPDGWSGLLQRLPTLRWTRSTDVERRLKALRRMPDLVARAEAIDAAGLEALACDDLVDLRALEGRGLPPLRWRDRVRQRTHIHPVLARVVVDAYERFTKRHKDVQLSLGDIAQPGCGQLTHNSLVRWVSDRPAPPSLPGVPAEPAELLASELLARAALVDGEVLVVETTRGDAFPRESTRFDPPEAPVRVEHRLLAYEVLPLPEPPAAATPLAPGPPASPATSALGDGAVPAVRVVPSARDPSPATGGGAVASPDGPGATPEAGPPAPTTPGPPGTPPDASPPQPPTPGVTPSLSPPRSPAPDTPGLLRLRVATRRYRALEDGTREVRDETFAALKRLATDGVLIRLDKVRTWVDGPDGERTVETLWRHHWVHPGKKRQAVVVARRKLTPGRFRAEKIERFRTAKWQQPKPGSMPSEVYWEAVRDPDTGGVSRWARWGVVYEAGHQTHLSGLDIDISYVTKDNTRHFAIDVPNIRALTSFRWFQAMDKAAKDAGVKIDRILVDRKVQRHVKRAVGRKLRRTKLWRQTIRRVGGHDAHHHVRVTLPSKRATKRAWAWLSERFGDELDHARPVAARPGEE